MQLPTTVKSTAPVVAVFFGHKAWIQALLKEYIALNDLTRKPAVRATKRVAPVLFGIFAVIKVGDTHKVRSQAVRATRTANVILSTLSCCPLMVATPEEAGGVFGGSKENS
jgi:hypothetical protein